MKILWLSTDRWSRVARYYDPLREAVTALPGVDVTWIPRDLGKMEGGAWCQQMLNTRDRIEGDSAIVDVDLANAHDVIVCDAVWGFMTERWKHITTPRAAIMVDLHGPMVLEYTEAAFNDFGFKLFLTRYKDSLPQYHRYIPRGMIRWLPLEIDPAVFHDYGEPKDGTALMTGTVNEAYPVREQTDRECQGAPWYRRIPRPPENGRREWPVDEDYARELGAATLAFSCLSSYAYPIKKMFEIPACKTVLVSDHNDEMARLGFLPGRNMLAFDPLRGYRQQIVEMLARPDLDAIAQAGFDLVHSNHTAAIRARQLVQMLVEVAA
jgi:hypothetical protein